MRRLFWVALGATAGVLVVRRLGRTLEAYTPEGVGSSIAGLTDAVRELAADVREGMAVRERELRIALGVDTGTMSPEQAQQLIDDPTADHR